MCLNKLRVCFVVLMLCAAAAGYAQQRSDLKGADIIMLDMNLSALGVESDNVPNIIAHIDLVHDTSLCTRSFYNPKNPSAIYTLSRTDIFQVKQLLNQYNLFSLDSAYTCNRTDQPTSTITIYTSTQQFTITDYGLLGPNPLPLLYGLVYKYGD